MSDRVLESSGSGEDHKVLVWGLEVHVPAGTNARLSARAAALSAAVEAVQARALVEGATALQDEVAAAWAAWALNRSQPPTYALPTTTTAPETIYVPLPADSSNPPVGFPTGVPGAMTTCAIHLRNMHRDAAPDTGTLALMLRGVALVGGIKLLEAEL